MSNETPSVSLQRLKNITQLVRQVNDGIVANIDVQKTHPDRLREIESALAALAVKVSLIREEDEIGAAGWEEIAEALPIVIDRLNNQMTIDKNMSFLQATDKQHLKRFLGYVLEYGLPLFVEVMDELLPEDRDKLKQVVNRG